MSDPNEHGPPPGGGGGGGGGGRTSLGLFLSGLALGLFGHLRRSRRRDPARPAAALEGRALAAETSSAHPEPTDAAPLRLPQAEDEEQPLRWGHASETTSVRGVTLFAIGLLVALVLIQLALWGAAEGFADLSQREGYSIEQRIPREIPPDRRTTAEGPPPPPAAPGVPHWEDPPGDLQALMREQERRLLDYRWIDRERGVLGIPIQRAMDLLVERRQREEGPR